MKFGLSLPRIMNSQKSTKDTIVQLLSSKWPLTAKEIYRGLQTEIKRDISYQAVHKVLAELVDDGIITKQGKTYLISREWISRIKKFGNALENNYSKELAFNFENINGSVLTPSTFRQPFKRQFTT